MENSYHCGIGSDTARATGPPQQGPCSLTLKSSPHSQGPEDQAPVPAVHSWLVPHLPAPSLPSTSIHAACCSSHAVSFAWPEAQPLGLPVLLPEAYGQVGRTELQASKRPRRGPAASPPPRVCHLGKSPHLPESHWMVTVMTFAGPWQRFWNTAVPGTQQMLNKHENLPSSQHRKD